VVTDLDIAGLVRNALDGDVEIVCLCGSMRFREEFADAILQLTLAGLVVLSPAEVPQGAVTITEEQKATLDRVHLRKIDLADVVLVVDPGGYVGASTAREIAYAKAQGTPVVRLSDVEHDRSE